MKVLLTIAITIISLNLFSQDLEKKVCDCIENNLNQINFDYFKTLKEIEDDLIANQIIQKSSESRIRQIGSVSKLGLIETPRSYENILFEQIGLRTIKYCINVHTYGSQKKSSSQYFKLMRELDYLNQNIQKPIDLIKIRKYIASTILKYQNNEGNSKLWKLIHLEYLYMFSETKEMKELEILSPFRLAEKDTTNTIKIHVNSNDEIILEKNKIELNQICSSIHDPKKSDMGIYLTNERATKYKFYLEVYNSIKDCIQQLRNKESLKEYGKEFDEINDKQKEEIMNTIPLRIIESTPK